MSRRLPPLLLAVLLLSCGVHGGQDVPLRARAAPRLVGSPEDPSLLVEGISNGGFELVADSTTSPPKYGAYWLGAFSPLEGEAWDRVVEIEDAPDGARVLLLSPADAPVQQKLVLDPRWSAEVSVSFAWRARGGARLAVALQDGPARRVSEVLAGKAEAGAGADASGWSFVTLPLGRAFAEEHGEAPRPRLLLEFAVLPPEDGESAGADAEVEIDAVSVPVRLAALDAARLAESIRGLVTWQLDLFLLGPDEGGLGLVDPETGYVVVDGYDVNTGGDLRRTRTVSFHSIHTLLALWMREARALGWEDEIARYAPHLRRIVTTLLDRHFHSETGLPLVRRLADGEALLDAPQTVGAFVEFLLAAAPLLGDEDLARRCRDQARAVADTLVALQRAHDLDPDEVRNRVRVNQATGIFEGEHPNWFGHIPDRLTPTGTIDTPRRFNTSWAIVTRRSFWYHLLRSPRTVARAFAIAPREGDEEAVHRALSLYHRDWDAARYDLENDTDDHYGYLCEDLLDLLRHSRGEFPDALRLVQQATDHRLERDVGGVGDTLWIQAVRLGTACAGDSPRAFKGVLDLYELPPEVNPETSRLPLYREAILELAANDWKGRQLTNGEFTESFFKNWEMVCICFHGTYQGDCRERPISEWHGDVGDIFGGPPRSSIEAQIWAYAVANAEERPEILARMGTLLHVTEASLRRPYGYLYGLDPAIARQYELPEKYVTGLDERSMAGLAYTISWALALERLRDG